MKRFGFPATFALFALFCGPLVGSAAADPPANLPLNVGFPPQVGVTLAAAIQDPTDDEVDWVSCDATGNVVAPLLANSTSYQLGSSDQNSYVCAVETPIGNSTDILYESAPVGPIGVGPSVAPTGPVQEGETLTVTPGAWGLGVVPTDTWQDCDSTGANCVPVASGATGSSYAVARSDVGATIEVAEGVLGAPLDSTASTGVVTATPPIMTSVPTVSGTAQVGSTLTASPGVWSNDPTGYTYQWNRCSPQGCSPISTPTDQTTYVPAAGDIGDTIVVLVDGVIDRAQPYGSAGVPYPASTGQVLGVSTSPPTNPGIATVVPVTNPHVSAVGRLTATMRWTFRYAPSYTQVAALSVQGPALGATIATRCSGKGCPFIARRVKVRTLKRCRARSRGHCRAPREVSLERQFRGHNLAVGSRVTVTISRAHDIGKYYRFVVRRRRAPSVSISCVAPGSNVPGRNCTGL